MSNVLDKLKQKNRAEHTFTDGLVVGFHYPDMEDYILDGRLPAVTLTAGMNGSEPTEEEAAAVIQDHPDEFRLQLEIVRRVVTEMLDSIDGTPIEPDDDRAAIVSELGIEKRQVLFRIANRQMEPSMNGADSGEA
jgi:hypothetical protein